MKSDLLKKTEATREALEKMAENNFGYCDDNPETEKLLNTLRALESSLKENSPLEYEQYAEKWY